MRRCIGMRFLLVLIALIASTEVLAQARTARICYFSLNNEKEFQSVADLAKKLNAATGHNIIVKEYMNDGDNPETAFRRMVNSGEKCDGLVISGHHYGAWEGKRANGRLRLDFIEKLSCDPRYKNWFKNINSLHLQGCRTLGVGQIVADDPAFSADANTSRVNRLATIDSIEQGVEEMNHEYTNTLDQENPLSSRYLRTFPRATTFGWTKTAPGESAKSELSMLYHIAHMAQVNNYHQRGVIVDPKSTLKPTDAAELANAVLDMIQKPDWDNCENTSIKAWKNHGTPIKNKGYGYNNPDLNAYKSYESTNSPEMVKLKEIGCKFKNATTPYERSEVLKEILSDRKLIATNFSAIIDLSQSRDISESERRQLLMMMKSSRNLESFIGDKFNTPQVGLFAKIDYYTFFKKVFNKPSPDAERIITEDSFKVLLKPYPSYSGQAPVEVLDLRDFKATLTSSLAKNGFVNESFMSRIYANRTNASNQMFKVLYNKMLSTSIRDPRLTEMAALVAKLKPLADSIPKSTP